jgi:hypothetical protein
MFCFFYLCYLFFERNLIPMWKAPLKQIVQVALLQRDKFKTNDFAYYYPLKSSI